MNPAARIVVAVLVVAGIGGGAFLWWRQRQTPPPPPPPVVAQPTPPAPPPPAPPPEPAIKHPIEPASSKTATPLPPLAESDPYILRALIDLLGRKGVLSFLITDDFARHFVATVDNLANERASTQMWPVKATAGRFEAEASAAGSAIATRNADRYKGLVSFATAVETRRVVGAYVRLYPLFQQAYEDLGYPGKYFNDRVVEVIDHLLATPEVGGPIKVRLVEIKDPNKPARPGTLYQFEDPTLEARSAGQKILLRVGPENSRALKAKLVELRAQLIRGASRLSK